MGLRYYSGWSASLLVCVRPLRYNGSTMRFRPFLRRQVLGGALLLGGAVLLLSVGASLAYRQWQDWQFAKAVAVAPTRIVVTARVSLPTVAVPTLPLTATPEPPTVAAIGAPSVLPDIGEEGTPEPASAQNQPAGPTATPVITPIPPSPTPLLSPTSPPTPSPTPIPSSLPVRLVMPWLGLNVPVVEMSWQVKDTPDGPVSEWVVPDNAAGHHVNSASLGEVGNVVISGHNNIKGKVFKPISVAFDPKQPDKFLGEQIQVIAADGRTFNYVVKTVYFFLEKGATLAERQANGRVMDATSEPMLTIITCWPPSSNTHRIVIQAALDTREQLDSGMRP